MNLLRKIIIAGFQFSSFLFNMLLLLIFFFSFTEGTVLFFKRATAVIRSHTHGDPNPFLEEMIVVFIAFPPVFEAGNGSPVPVQASPTRSVSLDLSIGIPGRSSR